MSTIVLIIQGEDQLSGPLAKAGAETKAFGSAASATSIHLGGLGKVASGVGGALSHATGQLKNLVTGPLGMIGLGAGILTASGALEKAIGKAQDWGLQIEKLQGITHDSAESLSGLLAVTEKYGLANERLTQIAGFAVKTLGNMTKGSNDNAAANDKLVKAEQAVIVDRERLTAIEAKGSAAAATLSAARFRLADAEAALSKAQADAIAGSDTASKFQDQYGFSILDSGGKVKDFSTLLLTFADYWKNGAETPAIKAAAAAHLFGRGFADLVPILNLGAKGIQDAEDQAKALGLTLTEDNVTALAKMREATRQLGDAMGGLELQIGLALIPTITDFSKAVTTFVGEHRDEIVGFVRGLASTAEEVAGMIGNVVGGIQKAWNMIPGPLQSLILQGIVADRTMKFFFAFSPIHFVMELAEKAVTSAIGSALGSTIGNSIAGTLLGGIQKVFVVNPGFGGGGIPNLVEDAAGAAAGLGAGTLALLVALPIAAVAAMDWLHHQLPGFDNFQKVIDAQNAPKPPSYPAPIGPGTSGSPLGATAPGGALPLGPGTSGFPIGSPQDMAAALISFRAGERDAETAMEANTAALKENARADWLKKLEASWMKAGQTMHDKIKAALADLAAGKNVHEAAAFVGAKLGNAGFGAGGYDQALAAIASLKNLHSSDPAVAAAIRELNDRLPRLKLNRDELVAAEKEAQSSDPKNVKLDKLAAIERENAVRGDPTTHKKLDGIVAAVKAQKTRVTMNVSYEAFVNAASGASSKNTVSIFKKGGSTTVSEFGEGGEYRAGVPRIVGDKGPELDIPRVAGSVIPHAGLGILAQLLAGGPAAAAPRDAGLERAMLALAAATEALSAARGRSSSPALRAYVTARDVELAQAKREAVGPSRARQAAYAG